MAQPNSVTHNQADTNTITQLRSLGFSDTTITVHRRLIAAVSGKTKTGKTNFACTAPSPIVYINVDIGTEGVVNKFQEKGKQILVLDVSVPKQSTKEIYLPMWLDLKAKILKAYSLQEGTMVWDSVAEESPLLLKGDDGMVWVGTIADFWDMNEKKQTIINTPKGEQVLPVTAWRTLNTVWNPETKQRVNPWTPIKHIIRHPFKGKLLRITTAGGTIRVTANHSLMSGVGWGAKFINAGELKIGDELSLPMYARTPSNLCRNANRCSVFVGTLDLAWTYGLFVAEGSAYLTHDERSPSWVGASSSIVNKNEALIDRAIETLKDVFHVPVGKCLDAQGIYHATIEDTNVSLYLKQKFYNRFSDKIVPVEILNAKPEVKTAFIDGYLAGDGHYNERGDIWEFDTKSPALAQALIWMKRSSSMDSRDVSVFTRQDKPNITRVTFPQDAVGARGRIKAIVEEDYDGMIYDLETENHAFCAGVGGILCHNTESEIYELCRLARLGKLTQVLPHNYTEVNSEFRDLLRTAYESSMSTIFIRKMKPKWVNNARTSEYESAGFGDMEYNAQANLETYRQDNPEGGMPEFSVFVRDCRLNPELNGQYLTGPMCDFTFLLGLIHDK